MKRSFGILCGVALSALAAPVQAQDYYEADGGLYISGRGGLSQIRDNTWFIWPGLTDDPLTPADESFPPQDEYRRLEMEPGFVVAGAVGYTFAYPQHVADLRVEAEGIYRYHKDGQTNSDFSSSDPNDTRSYGKVVGDIEGTVQLQSIMFNVLADFHTGSRFVPFIGAGGGLTRMQVDVNLFDPVRSFRFLGNPALPIPIDETEYLLSWQAIGGLGYRLSPGAVIAAEFRYFRLASDRYSSLIRHEELSRVKFDDWSISLRFTF